MNASRASMDESSLLKSLREGDEIAFTWLVEQYHASLVRLALFYVHDEAVAEEVAQESWLAVLKGLNRFEGRSSLKTWIFTILTNRAKTRRQREGRTLTYSELEETLENKPTIDPGRFRPSTSPNSANHWAVEPAPWTDIPEEALLSKELLNIVRGTVASLPENQRAVITLRDIEELSSDDVCNVLGISETNQRVLLHRARARVRKALEDYVHSENLSGENEL